MPSASPAACCSRSVFGRVASTRLGADFVSATSSHDAAWQVATDVRAVDSVVTAWWAVAVTRGSLAGLLSVVAMATVATDLYCAFTASHTFLLPSNIWHRCTKRVFLRPGDRRCYCLSSGSDVRFSSVTLRTPLRSTLHSAAPVTFCGLVGCVGGSVAAEIAPAFGLRQGRPVLRADVTVTFTYT